MMKRNIEEIYFRDFRGEKSMNNIRRSNIRLIDRISDLAVATVILSIAMMVLGLSMIIGSALSSGHGHFIGSSILMLANVQGIEYIADGILLAAFCTMVATTSPLSASMKVLRISSVVVTIYNAAATIFGIALGKTSISFIVPLAGLVISGLILLILNKMDASAKKIATQRTSGAAGHSLRKAG